MENYAEILRPEVVAPVRTKTALAIPPGFEPATARVRPRTPKNLEEIKVKKAWEVAIAPAKGIPMNLFMSYMTGNSLQMIPIMMTFSLFWTPLKAIFSETNRVFKGLETATNAADILQAKVVFVLCQLACMSVGVWKLNKMGLIPNGEADWLGWKVPENVREVVTFI